MERDLGKGYVCHCGTYNPFSLWVFAHPTDFLLHTCACGRKNMLLDGVLIASGRFKGEPAVDCGETYVEF